MNNRKFSKIIVGTMSWGVWGKNYRFSEMQRLIETTVDLGISSFDHADIYGGYTTESAFGTAFSKTKISRANVQFISKCGIQLVSPTRQNELKHYDCSKEYIISSAEASLKHLQTEYLDVLLIHRPSPLMHPHEVMQAVEQLKKEGKINHFGVSNFTPSQIELISTEVVIDVNQIEFSAVHCEALFDGRLDKMLTENITPMAWAPLGKIFSKEMTPRKKRILEQLELLTTKYNASPDQLLLAWILEHPSGIHPVIGSTNLERIKAASEAVSIPLTTQDWFKILEASQGHEVP
ncbi:MAG: aldo/keto reductase [Flavobacteriaceae bacterium]|nr:aldo/keto reductase [Formosa sp.]MDG1375080.1 aldo/keto reductase [Flavobacteriaceae bacterium]MDG2499171.1 aldo/keto reductase [Flavobacteriaceae bacterium]